MSKFLVTYHSTHPSASPEESKAMMQRWQDWAMANSDALLEAQNPVSETWTIEIDGAREGSLHPMMGYSVLEASEMQAAIEILKSCPFLEMGSLEVSQLIQMD